MRRPSPRPLGRHATSVSLVLVLVLCAAPGAAPEGEAFGPGRRVLLDAHNCYPTEGAWADRVDRALRTGLPVAIEQDLVWHCPTPGTCRSVVSHGDHLTGREPTLEAHFFERVRPLVERARAGGPNAAWPVLILNLDFKTNEPEHHAAVWDLLGRHETWLTTAPRTATAIDAAPLRVGPVLVLTGDHAEQERSFHDRVPVGATLRLFGAVTVEGETPSRASDRGDPDAIPPRPAEPGPRTNYRRWWNNPWAMVEGGGPARAGAWTSRDEARLHELVARARRDRLWIRFYTLNGHTAAESRGWNPSYNFGSRAAVRERWTAAIRAGVDFIATDQYEDLATTLSATR